MPPGAAAHSVVDDLYFKNIISNRFLFNLLIKIRRHGPNFKAGDYVFRAGTTLSTLLTQLQTGSGLVYHTLIIVPGWTMRQVRAALMDNPYLTHTIDKMSDALLMASVGVPGVSPEGRFFPDTYYFSTHAPDISLLKRSAKAMQDKMNFAWKGRLTDLPFKNETELLIAASLIEKETGLDVERPIIAGVILNRLKANILLQFDPTVIYGMGNQYTGTIHKADLLRKTPYNTYTMKGLPPTPIAIPSMESLMAAAHPAQHAYLYFVARGDASHQFSETLAEHNKAVGRLRNLMPAFFNYTMIRSRLSAVLFLGSYQVNKNK